MKKFSNKIILTNISIIILIAIVFNILFFFTPTVLNDNIASNYITYSFTMFVLLVSIPLFMLSVKNKEKIQIIYSIRIIRNIYLQVILQLVVAITFITLHHYLIVPFWCNLLVELIILLFFAISIIIRITYKYALIKLDKKGNLNKQNLEFIKNSKIAVKCLLDTCIDDRLLNELNDLYEIILYSDPVSSGVTEEIEDDISINLGSLQKFINNKNYDNALDTIKSLKNLFKKRTTTQLER